MTESEQQDIFESWLSQHKGLLFKVIRAYPATLPDQDDLFQEIVLQIWRSIPKFRQESAVTIWLYRIALNTYWPRNNNALVCKPRLYRIGIGITGKASGVTFSFPG